MTGSLPLGQCSTASPRPSLEPETGQNDLDGWAANGWAANAGYRFGFGSRWCHYGAGDGQCHGSTRARPCGPKPFGAAPLFPLPAGPVQPKPCSPPKVPPPPPTPLGPPAVPETAVPLVGPPPPRRVNLSAISGKGIWLTVWPGSRLDATAVVAAARSAGLRQLWLRTGSSQNGFYGSATLRELVPVAHAAGISVIAWDFPTLSNPAADAARAALAFRSGADAFSPDIETSAEGTYLTARRVRYYLSLVRGIAGQPARHSHCHAPNRLLGRKLPVRR